MEDDRRIAVIGAGSWGTALAKVLGEQGHSVVLWAREPEIVECINTDRHNPLFLTEAELPASVGAVDDLEEATADAHVILNAVPTQFIRSVYGAGSRRLSNASIVVTASKGVEADSHLLPHEILSELGASADGIVALSGPSFAHEVGAGLPTAVVAAGSDRQRTLMVRDLFSTRRFRVYSSGDIVGVELGGALKNVIAIAAGVVDGLGVGLNARAAIVTRGLAEITRLGVAVGGEPQTFAGLSGLGDLLLTCTGGQSRNHTVGVELGRGRSWTEISAEMREVAEGVPTSRSARELGNKVGIELPITENVYLMLYEEKDPAEAIFDLTSRSLKDEHDPVVSDS